MIDRRAEIDALLDAALDLQPRERSAFLAGIGDVELRRDVAELLRFADDSTDPIELNARAAVALIDALADSDVASEWSLQWQALKPQLPDRIGAWRVLDRIGEGGMGEVLKVVRDDAGFQQYGALKMVRAGYADGDFTRRFVQERQILARLNHPGIAGLLDGGVEDERHFLVMEFIEGEAIDRYCDRNRLRVEARIDLFVEVARAVAHAHRQLIVHRDLKPSNVLVRSDGRVKLLDFGIAKVIAHDGTDTERTRVEQRMFTPDYASPEQARGEAVGTASDVYQLGLLLYELLSGQRAQRVKGSAAEIERAIVAQVPTTLSRSIELEALEIAARRAATPAQLKRALRGDLDIIVGKAIEKDIERRYPSVDALIDDLERSRRGQPLMAKPDTLGYRGWRFLRRHPVGVSFATSTVLLVMGYLITLWFQSAALERERDRARAEADKARQVQTLVQRLFEGIDPDVSGGANLSVRALLDRSFGDIERELNTQPEVRAELLLTVGDVYFALGEYQRATELLRQASGLADGFVASEPILAARIYRSLGRVEAIGNDLPVADQRLSRALALLRGNSGPPLELAACLYQMAELRGRQGRWEDAQAMSYESLVLRRANLQVRNGDLADSLIQSAWIDRRLGQSAKAEALLREALDSMRATLPATHPRLAETRADLASMLRTQGRLEESESLFREAISGLDQSRGDEHPFLGIVLNNYGNLLLELGKPQDAEATQRRALDIHRKTHGDLHPRVALAWNSLGTALRAQNRGPEALSSFQSALSALPATHRNWRANLLRNLAIAQLDTGDCENLLMTVAQFEQAARSHSQRAVAMRLRAECLLRLGRASEALATVDAALAIFRTLPDDKLEHADAERLSGDIHFRMGNHIAARAAFSSSAALMSGLNTDADAARERLAQSTRRLPDQSSDARDVSTQ